MKYNMYTNPAFWARHLNIVVRLVDFLNQQYDKGIKLMLVSAKTLAREIGTKPYYIKGIIRDKSYKLGFNVINGHYIVHTIASHKILDYSAREEQIENRKNNNGAEN